MENIYFNRVDMAEWFPGAKGYHLQALNENSDELEAEITLTKVEFWSLPGDTFDLEDLEDDFILWRMESAYTELQGK